MLKIKLMFVSALAVGALVSGLAAFAGRGLLISDDDFSQFWAPKVGPFMQQNGFYLRTSADDPMVSGVHYNYKSDDQTVSLEVKKYSAENQAQAIQAYGMKCWAGGGATVSDQVIAKTLQQWVAAGYPCVLLLDMTQVTNVPGSQYWGHWAVAFAFDANHVYLTNWDYTAFRNDWTSFYSAWKLPTVYNDRRYWMVIGWV